MFFAGSARPSEYLRACHPFAVAGVQYLLTLNCKHIANARELPRVYRLLEQHGFGQLLICTPAEFLGDNDGQESDSG
jgi:hypothetical protein